MMKKYGHALSSVTVKFFRTQKLVTLDRMRDRFIMVQESRPIPVSAADQSVPFPANSSARSGSAQADSVASAMQTTALSKLSFFIAPALFIFSAALLVFKLGQHPAFVYNWESYNSFRFFPWWDHPSTVIFHVNEGLMSDAGL